MIKDATYWAEQIKCGTISREELLNEHVQRIREKNPDLNALVEVREDLVKEELNARQETTGLFEGVPMSLKMLGHDKKGLGSTFGSHLFEGAVASGQAI